MYNFDEILFRIQQTKKEQGLTIEELAQLSEVPKGTLSKILAGLTKDPQISNIIKIAKALNVSTNYLIYGDCNNENKQSIEYFSVDEQQLIEMYRELNEEGQERASNYIEDLVDTGKYTKNSKIGILQQKA